MWIRGIDSVRDADGNLEPPTDVSVQDRRGTQDPGAAQGARIPGRGLCRGCHTGMVRVASGPARRHGVRVGCVEGGEPHSPDPQGRAWPGRGSFSWAGPGVWVPVSSISHSRKCIWIKSRRVESPWKRISFSFKWIIYQRAVTPNSITCTLLRTAFLPISASMVALAARVFENWSRHKL